MENLIATSILSKIRVVSLNSASSDKVPFSWKKSLVATILISSNIAWLFFFDNYFEMIFENSVGTHLWISVSQAIFFGFIVVSAIIGALINKKVSQRKLLSFWLLLGVFSTGAMVVVEGIFFSLLFSALLGVSFGLGFPLSVVLIIDRTPIGKRGKISGFTMFGAFIVVFVALGIVSFLDLGLIEILLIAMILKATGFLTLILDSCKRKIKKEISWKSILAQENFIKYFLPYILFNLASGLTNLIWAGLPPTPEYAAAYTLGSILQFIGTAVIALMSGFISDRLGRKPPIIIAVLLFAVSYAILGIATSELSGIIHLTTLGVAWGFLMVVYLIIPGDLAQIRGVDQEKYYALATVLPFAVYMSLSALPKTLEITAPANILSPILSIILFLSIIPILYATETLPLSKIRKRKIKEQIGKLEKIIKESKEDT